MRSTRLWQAMAVLVWAVTIAGGAGYLAAHGARAGDAGPSPAALDPWREILGLGGGLGRDLGGDSWTVVMAAHPRCPCTRASADELELALAGATEPRELVILAFRPEAGAANDHPGFADTPTLRRLASLDGARVVADPGGALAARLGALTSGHTLVYDPSGRLRFAGGLTPSRAHVGPNTGSAAVRALLRAEPARAADAPVYGCPLDNSNTNSNTNSKSAGVDLGGCVTIGETSCQP